MKYHPDKNPDNEAAKARFLEINEAYSTLGDDAKRREYDLDQRQAQHNIRVHSSTPRTGPRSSGAYRHTRDTLNPDDWILHRRPGAYDHTGPRMYDFAAHQRDHYPEAGKMTPEQLRTRRQQARMREMFWRKANAAAKMQDNLVSWFFLSAFTVFFIFFSGIIELIWLEGEEGFGDVKLLEWRKRPVVVVARSGSEDVVDEEGRIRD
ncbi:hypothetical protein HDV00_001812 [Rhizophlyctis rosea]|nr:hypothetical protein HDV00_001812 [Rhizophlyctis rosea]